MTASVRSVLLLGPLLVGCSASTPRVETGQRPENTEVTSIVHEPPPPAEVEVVPLRRSPSCRWLDGYFDYRGRSWQWVKGRWVKPPDACYYARPVTQFERTPSGVRLVYRRGAFFPEKKGGTCAPVESCLDVTSTPEEP